MPFPELGAIVAPIAEVVAGPSLLLGLFPRIGALIAIGSMSGALVAHLRFDWADEPPLMLPIAVLLLALVVLVRGAGTWALRSGSSPKDLNPR